jgi:hypothetical protein
MFTGTDSPLICCHYLYRLQGESKAQPGQDYEASLYEAATGGTWMILREVRRGRLRQVIRVPDTDGGAASARRRRADV